MKLVVCLAAVVAVVVSSVPVNFEYDNPIEEAKDEPIVEDFVPEGVKLGQVSGLAIDSSQHLHIFHRGGRVWDASSFDNSYKFEAAKGPINASTLLTVDPVTGKVLERGGAGRFYMPHGMTVDNEDNIWVTDVALHQVFKIPKGSDSPSMVLGKAFQPGSDDEHFCQPTDVAVASNGDFFVADGYCNSRIMKFDKSGNLLAKFGSANSGYPVKNGQFNIPHSIALIEDLDLLCVADRENERIQCFSAGVGGRSLPTGLLITKAENLGRVFAIREKAHYLVGATSSDLRGATAPQVFVMDMNSGRVETYAKTVESPHALAITEAGAVFVGETTGRIVKLSLGRAN